MNEDSTNIYSRGKARQGALLVLPREMLGEETLRGWSSSCPKRFLPGRETLLNSPYHQVD